MFSLIVGLVMVGLAASAPSPGIYHGGLAIPAATSYSSRVDVHTPVVKTAVVAPIVASYSPYVSSYGYGLGHDYDHSLGYGSYGLGHEYGLGHSYGLGYNSFGHNYGYGHDW